MSSLRIFKSSPAIYKITNRVNGKIYIGSASDVSRRIIYHKNTLRNKKHTNRHLQAAFLKYGEQNFTFEVIEYLDDKLKLRDREQYWMDLLKVCDEKFGYNIVPNSQHKMLSEETKRLLRLRPVRSGWKHTPETKQRISILAIERNRLLGKEPGKKFNKTGLKRSELCGDLNVSRRPEVRQKISEALRGRKLSEETKMKISLKNKGSKHQKLWVTSVEERDQIRHDHERIGMTFCEIAGIYGMSRVTVRNIVKRKYYGDIPSSY